MCIRLHAAKAPAPILIFSLSVTDVRYFAACYPAMLKNFAAREHSPFASVASAGMLARALGMINRGAVYVRAEVL